jgi:Protein of unknown function (DUF2911)
MKNVNLESTRKNTKTLISIAAMTLLLFLGFNVNAQDDNAKRKSPHTKVTQNLDSGASVIISYGQPAIKGRTIGKDLEPKEGKVWRTGADEATTFEINKAVKVNGQELPSGKYSFFTLVENGEWTLIFNKTAEQWGAYDYKSKEDILRVKVKPQTGSFSEKLTFTIDKNGQIKLLWGDISVGFKVE